MVSAENQFFNMKAKIQTIFTVLALAGTIDAQSINVTPTGVGIGTATPTQKLDVAGNIAATGNVTVGGTLTSTGNVGIGTATPAQKLDVAGNIAATGNVTVGGGLTAGGNVAASGNLTATGDIYSGSKLTILGNTSIGSGASPAVAKVDIAAPGGAVPLLSLRASLTGVGQYQMIRFGDASQITDYQKGAIIYESVGPVARGRMHIALENTDGAGSVALSDAKLTVLSNGNVGVGTVNPTFKFTVNGTMMCRGYYTDTGSWSDYVFAKDYKLPTLTEVEQHIAANGHLPGIPSEKEVLSKGFNLAEMDSKLLAQIEQLTLHMIALNKQMESQQAEIKALRAESLARNLSDNSSK